MFVFWPILVILGLGFFMIGTVVGSFLNVCIYRIPWQKSVIWPGSRCPICFGAIAARDNIPIVSWIALRGECRRCGAPISVRYPLVEALVGFLFLGVYLVDVIAGPPGAWGQVPAFQLVAAAYHAVFLALLVAATFIDYDLMIIPDQITITGMVVGVGLGTLWPQVRPVPASWPAITHLQGFLGRLAGLVGRCGFDPVCSQDRRLCRSPRGDGLWRRHLDGDDRCIPGLAGRGPHLFPGPVSGIGTRGMEVVEILEKTAQRRPIIQRRSRNPFWAIP